MLMLVSGATATVRRYRSVGELILPGAWSHPDSLKLVPGKWAMDNGAYSGFDAEAFMTMLERFHGRKGCRWVSCPDVVGDAHGTLGRWPFWSKLVRGVGFVPALVLQDGMLAKEIPWSEVGAVFVGGTDHWKFSPQAHELVGYARARGLDAHCGRVNSAKRIGDAHEMGCLTFDGGQYSRWANRRIPEGLVDSAHAVAQQGLAL